MLSCHVTRAPHSLPPSLPPSLTHSLTPTHAGDGFLLSHATLVVCNVSLVGQWAEEARSKVVDKDVRIYEYHGQSRKRRVWLGSAVHARVNARHGGRLVQRLGANGECQSLYASHTIAITIANTTNDPTISHSTPHPLILPVPPGTSPFWRARTSSSPPTRHWWLTSEQQTAV